MKIIVNKFKDLPFASETSDLLHTKINFAMNFTKIVDYTLTKRVI